MRDLWRYLSHPYYWRRAVLRAVEAITRRHHLETDLDQLIDENALRIRQVDVPKAPLPGAGIRLLYVAPKFDYGNPARGYSYEENHFLPPLVNLGFDVIRFDSLSLVRRFGKEAASDLLVELAYRFRPVAAFFVLFRDDFTETAVDELRRNGCVTFNWFTDDHWRFDAFSSRWAPHFSWVITTDAAAAEKYRRLGVSSVIRSQWAVNHHLYRPLDRPRKFAVTFLGQPHGDRRRSVDALRRAGIPVEVWGYGWPRGKLSTRRAVEIINESEVNLNLSNASVGRTDQIKGRDFEVPGCRGLLLTKRLDALGDYYEIGRDILTYDGIEELEQQIRWALAHPTEADQVREAGYRRVLRDHTYERRFTEIFREAGLFR